ncbi:penicillin binding transpeptidase domain protein, partial [Vibrio parahaemolyticus EKP-028]
RVMTVICHVR